jgi:hypothetical protein
MDRSAVVFVATGLRLKVGILRGHDLRSHEVGGSGTGFAQALRERELYS